MFTFDLTVRLENLIWQSDWNGYEVGYDDIDVVGLYAQEQENEDIFYFYIDMEKMRILEFWCGC